MTVLTSRVRAMGIRDRPISPRSPWQNGIIGTVRRECLDRILIFSESQLRRVSGAIVAIPILAGLHHQYVRI
jgi:hypothetical protein